MASSAGVGTGLTKPLSSDYAPRCHKSFRDSEVVKEDFIEVVSGENRFRAKVFIMKLKHAEEGRKPKVLAFGVEVVDSDETKPSYTVKDVKSDPNNASLYHAKVDAVTYMIIGATGDVQP